MKIKFLLPTLITVITFLTSCTENIQKKVDSIKEFTFEDKSMVNNLETICIKYPARLSGSENNNKAQEYVFSILRDMNIDTVVKQPVTVPHWNGGTSTVTIYTKNETILLPSVNLGLAVGTDGKDIKSKVVMVSRKSQLDSVNVKGKIVFFNQIMKERMDYGKAGWQRVHGASLASAKGAIGIIVRSVTNSIDDLPHTGVVWYDESLTKIPAIAISTVAANTLAKEIDKDFNIKISINSTAQRLDNSIGNNVYGEIRGSRHPENVILITGHLDSWHIAQGAHDDASGVVMAINVLKTFKELRIKPNNTIRVMPYQDEETRLSGIDEYVKNIDTTNVKHLFHIELDSGIGNPDGFIMFAEKEKLDALSNFVSQYLVKANGDSQLEYSGEPVYDNWWTSSKLHSMFGYFKSDNPNYFVYHHAPNDNFEAVDINQLKECSATVTSLIYVVDKYFK